MPTGSIFFPCSDAQGNTTLAETVITVGGGEPPPDQLVSGNQPGGFTVPAGQIWEIQGLVTSPANVVVQGTLRMRPGATLRFTGVSESAFVGGDTLTPIASDVGLWMIDQGRLDAQGTPKTPWTRAVGSIAAGAMSFDVLDSTGWQVGDDINITATVARSVSNYWLRHDRRTITGISGNTITVNSPLSNAHPARSFSGVTYTAEVLNLSRDVKVQGTAGGRSHIVFLRQGTQAFQQIPCSYVELQHLGPRKNSNGVGGRYAWHYHHSGETTDGLINRGIVAKDCGNHCFVPHLSNGVTWEMAISHETAETPYWWDYFDASERVIYDRCVASRFETFEGDGKFVTHGFFASETTVPLASKMLGCVATGGDASSDPSGFFWDNDSIGVWLFEDCLSHNIRHMGIRLWQNSSDHHPVDRFHAYSCAEGIQHGAYSNNYAYHDLKIHDCNIGMFVFAVSRFGPAGRFGGPNIHLEFHRVQITSCSQPLRLSDAAVDSEVPTDFLDCTGLAPVTVEPGGGGHIGQTHNRDFKGCGLSPSDFTWLTPIQEFTQFRTQDASGQWWQITDANPNWVQIPPPTRPWE